MARWLRFKNAANTSVVFHGGKLLALWEGGLPYRLDPRTLATLGEDDMGGRLRSPFGWLERTMQPHLPFSAHPRLDRRDGSLWNFGTLYGRRSRLMIYRDLAPDFTGEPIIVPRPGGTEEDDAWVITLVYRTEAHRSDLVVLDARDLSTVCVLALPHHVPPGFHGTWIEAGG